MTQTHGEMFTDKILHRFGWEPPLFVRAALYTGEVAIGLGIVFAAIRFTVY